MNRPNIFADVPNEGDSGEIESTESKTGTEGEQTTTDSQSEKKTTDTAASQEADPEKKDNTPTEKKEYRDFRKHPRYRNLLKKNQEYEREIGDLKKFKEEMEPVLKSHKNASIEVPEVWNNYFGGDKEKARDAYVKYLESTQAEKDKLKQEILEEIKGVEDKVEGPDKDAVEDASNFLKTEMDSMKTEGLKFDQNELMKFMIDYENEFNPIVDKDGNYDFRKGLKLMERLNPRTETDTTDEKKKIAGDAMRNKAKPITESKIPVVPRKILGPNSSWRDTGI